METEEKNPKRARTTMENGLYTGVILLSTTKSACWTIAIIFKFGDPSSWVHTCHLFFPLMNYKSRLSDLLLEKHQ